eukprot:2204762-Pyramimonas_sp.AAC.1
MSKHTFRERFGEHGIRQCDSVFERAAKYLGIVVGPGGATERWLALATKCLERSRSIQGLGSVF